MLKYRLLLLSFLFFSYSSQAQFLIEGTVRADSSWEKVVYLSLIPSLEDMHTVSLDMIAMQTPLDAEGHFRFQGDYLPKGDQLYRVHISKKGDPPSTIIIGGNDHNHFFLIGNPQLSCELSAPSDSSLWGKLLFNSCYVNSGLLQVDQILAEYEANASYDFSLGREYLKIARDEKLRHLADSTQNLLLALYALSQTHAEAHYLENPDYYHTFFERWGEVENAYLDDFRSSIQYRMVAQNPAFSQWLMSFCFLLIGLLFWPLYHWLKNFSKDGRQHLLQELSLQERKVFGLIREGKSNKEISEKLHIELTTVKSHVRNVYGKLKVNSRKEVVDFPLK
ncbi:MAG: helix-turn-helix transcriptional regulator [Bacteroidia bacterium]|nr:helix-turn-helix transcriptional regulator [Bacteroidia bacterium]